MVHTSARKISPYYQGMFAPVREEKSFDSLRVIGEIPRDLLGSFAINSSSPRLDPTGRYHWFDGDGMIHAVHLENGKASYRNRFIRTYAFEKERISGQALWRGILEPFVSGEDRGEKDTANTDLVWYNGRLLALWYLSGKPYEIDPHSLETRGVFDFAGRMSCNVSAHAKVDPETGDLIMFDFSLYSAPYFKYGVASGDGKTIQMSPVEIPGPRYFHDIAITKNYSIIFDLPLYYHPEKLREGRRIIQFNRALPARFGVIPRFGEPSDIRWFETSPFYMFHSTNAF